MMDIVGTITTVRSYLSQPEIKLAVKTDSAQKKDIVLPKNRTYRIPLFQREIRWDKANVNVLLADLARGERFLGNIILSIGSENICDIIDGQQRTTIIRMILEFVKSKYGDEIELFDLCSINNQSFPGFEELVSNGFGEDKFSTQAWDKIIKQDAYKQIDRLKDLWKTLSDSEILNDRYQVKPLIENLKASQVNIIASYSNEEDISIRYFLDVNLKGVKLDTEDIFKSYIFSQDSRDETKTLWQKNKQLTIQLNALKNGKKEQRYPLMKLYEHFLYCDLYAPKENGQDFSGVKFGENFCLTTAFKIDSKIFYEGTHVIEVICNKQYIFTLLQRIQKSIEIMINIVDGQGPNDNFKKLFNCSDRIDSIDIDNCHIILKKILLEKDIVPKILATKYILSFFDGNEHDKKEYKSIYSIFATAVLFSIFASKKESDSFYKIAKSTSWVKELNDLLYHYLSSYELTRGKLQAAYKYSDVNANNDSQQVSCKSLAAIVNFMEIKKENTHNPAKISNCQKFNDFLQNKEKFSVEHFIIGEGGTLDINTKRCRFNYKYPTKIKKYRNSLFNYIFIPRELNNNLGNKMLYEKLEIINQDKGIECTYSKKYCELLKKSFIGYPTSEKLNEYDTESKMREYLDRYFSEQFAGEFLEFATNLLKEVIKIS